MKIYITQDAEKRGIRCVGVEPCGDGLYYQHVGLGAVYYATEKYPYPNSFPRCELTEARAREVVREQAAKRWEELWDEQDKLHNALIDPDWPKVVEDG